MTIAAPTRLIGSSDSFRMGMVSETPKRGTRTV